MTVDSSLLQELDAPVRSFRLYALEQIIQHGASEEILAALEVRKSIEDDPECLTMIDHALVAVRSRLSNQSAINVQVTVDNVVNVFANLSTQEKIRWLSSLNPREVKSLASRAYELFVNENDSMVRAVVIRVFGKNWPRESLRDIVPYLKSDHLSTRVAVLETLIHQAPDLLARDLPRLLLSADARIRSLAVRGLAKIDFEAALEHLEMLFESNELGHVLGAMLNSVFFPFDRVKPMLLKRIAIEKDEKIVERLGLFLENNPDPETPYRLWEIAETASEGKGEKLKNIIRNSIAKIKEAGILGDKFQEYLYQLQNWLQKRAARQWIQEAIARIDDEHTNLVELEALILKRLTHPFYRSLIEESAAWPISEKSKAFLQEVLKKSTLEPKSCDSDLTIVQNQLSVQPSAPAQGQTGSIKQIVSKPYESMNHEEKVRAIASFDEKDKTYAEKIISNILNTTNSPNDICATALRTALRLKIPGYTQFARRFIKSNDSNLVSAAIEYLGTFDFDWLLPYIGNFLQSDNLRIKSIALRLLQRSDKVQAISAIRALLTSKNIEQQRAALAVMVYFEFALVRDLLFKFLINAKEKHLVETALFFFKSNPEIENLYILYRLEKLWEKDNILEFARIARDIRKENIGILVESGQLDQNSASLQESEFRKRWEDEIRRTTAPPPSYSVKTLYSENQTSITKLLTELRSYFADKSAKEVLVMMYSALLEVGRHNPRFIAVSILIIAAFWIAIGWEIGGDNQPVQVKSASVLAVPFTINGQIGQVEKTGLLVNGEDGKVYILNPPDGQQFDALEIGRKVKVTLIPFRTGEDGSIIGQCRFLELF